MGENCKYFNKAKAQGDGRKQRMPKTLGKMEKEKKNQFTCFHRVKGTIVEVSKNCPTPFIPKKESSQAILQELIV